MKKIIKSIIIISIMFFILSLPSVLANAPSSFPNRTYIIGTHEFTPGSNMSTQKIMLAAKTILGNKLDDMIIYYKNSQGNWVNAITSEAVVPPVDFEIEYIDTKLLVKDLTIETDPEDVTSVHNKMIVYVTLSTPTIGADIYYTLDGNTPTESSTKYVPPFGIQNNKIEGDKVTLKAIAIKSGEKSKVLTKEITFNGLFDFDSDTGTILKYNGLYAEVEIPGAIGGVTVTSIGAEAFDQNTSIQKVTIPKSVETIDEKAFYSTTSLEEVVFEEGSKLTSIGKKAFEQDAMLSSIILPNSLTFIGEGAFAGTTSLESIIIPENVTTIEEGAFSDSGLKVLGLPNNINIGESVFLLCNNLEEIIIGANVVIGDSAFALDYDFIDYFTPAYEDEITGGAGIYKRVGVYWTNILKEKLVDVINVLEANKANEIWETRVGLRAEFYADLVLANNVLEDMDSTIVDIENIMAKLMVSSFKAAKSKGGLLVVVPLFVDTYGNNKFANLTSAQKGTNEAIGFINMEKVKISEYGAAGEITGINLNILSDVQNLIDGAVDKYLAILDGINSAESVAEMELALKVFVDYTIEVYGDWEEAKENVNELALFAIDDATETYIIIAGVPLKVFNNKPYDTLTELVMLLMAP